MLIKEILKESLIHAITMAPILFFVFLFMEVLSKRSRSQSIARFIGHPILGPLSAAFLGLLPQCGFSVAATTMYLGGLIPTGSLIAAYISTSDEAIPILLGDPFMFKWVIALVGTKFIWGSLAGIAINMALKTEKPEPKSGTIPKHGDHGAGIRSLVAHALKHTLRISAIVFILSSFFNIGGHIMEDTISTFLLGKGLLRTVTASLIGLIPSCATSVMIAEGFRSGFMSFPAMVSGLCANAGLGILVLAKECPDKRQVFSVISLLLLSSVIGGSLATLLS